MTQLQWTTLEWWQPRVGQVFTVTAADEAPAVSGNAQLTLTEADGNPQQPRPFRLLFVGAPGLFLPQRIYRLHLADADPVDLFLVPMQPGAADTRFEAIFN